MTNREKLHRLVDELSEAELAPTLRLVETQRHDPMLQALANAPEDDEPWTDEDDAAVAESRADLAAGRALSHEEMLRKYG
jgi:predicted transcriptional regulator